MRVSVFLFLAFISINSFSQNTIPEVLKKHNKNTVNYIAVDELALQKNYILLDTRELKEFNVSHIENAICVGYDKFDSKKIKETLRNQEATIIVYCSIGIRSETIGQKLLKLGYKNVYNLYGGIFEWKNQGHEVVDNNQKPTENVHAFSKEWSKYLLKGIKVY
jgi:rhodanese-related sulfurtransferase